VLFLSYDETEPEEGGGGRLVVEETVEISGPIGGGREGEFFQGVVVNEHDGRDVIVISIWVGVVTVLDLRSVEGEEGKKEKKGGKRGKTSVGAGEGVEGESLIKAKYDLQSVASPSNLSRLVYSALTVDFPSRRYQSQGAQSPLTSLPPFFTDPLPSSSSAYPLLASPDFEPNRPPPITYSQPYHQGIHPLSL
jgi:hypothetical protein